MMVFDEEGGRQMRIVLSSSSVTSSKGAGELTCARTTGKVADG
jgi:hypothetical protein